MDDRAYRHILALTYALSCCIADLDDWATADPEGFTKEEKRRFRDYDKTLSSANKFLLKPERVPTKTFVDGNWSFRPVAYIGTDFVGFDVWPKGERGIWGKRAELRRASDGKTWLFIVWIRGKGRQDARPSFAEAKAEVLKTIGTGESR